MPDVPFLEAAVGAIIWTLANLLYADMRRKGIGGFGRLVAFWVGQPTTWFSLILIRQGRFERLDPPPDDDDRLLREIRVDRELRGLRPPDDAGSRPPRQARPKA